METRMGGIGISILWSMQLVVIALNTGQLNYEKNSNYHLKIYISPKTDPQLLRGKFNH